jgi:DNA-binding IclR family transcriptional regulator
LKDLTDLGYLNVNPETKRYFGHLRLAFMGAKVISSFELRDHIRPHLISLQEFSSMVSKKLGGNQSA